MHVSWKPVDAVLKQDLFNIKTSRKNLSKIIVTENIIDTRMNKCAKLYFKYFLL